MAHEKVIIDQDWGGDTMQVVAVLSAHPEAVSIVGATAVFGNTGHAQVLKNAGAILRFLNAEDVPYFPGAHYPSNSQLLGGDGAHGDDGMGGVVLPPATVAPQRKDAVDFILDTLKSEPPQTVTIIAAAPQTNIAKAIAQDPETMRRVKEIIIMGGCTQVMPAKDMPERQGNITPDAEFNFYMAAADARTVLNSGLPVTLFPMNCTHQMTLTPEREQAIRTALDNNRSAAESIIGMMRAPIEIDARKFGISPVMHDVHTALYMLHPECYEGRRGFVDVTVGGNANGRTDFRADENGPVRVMEKVNDPDKLFSYVVESFRIRLSQQPAPRPAAVLEHQ